MKKAFLYLLGIVLMATSCLDIADVYQRLDTLEQKVAGLEELNSTVSGLSNSVSALRNNVYVKEVTETAEGYVIKFTDNTQAVIRDGVDGEDGQTPTIGVKEEGGELVWTVNGKVVKDESGKPVPATVKTPEFQFDNNKWWYRFGPTDSWKDCGEKTGPEPSIEEDEEYVYINIGDNSIAIPKEVISPAIEEITVSLKPRKNLFIPVGGTADLKDFFEVEPEGALKTSVNFEYAEGAFTIDKKGIVTVTGNTVAVNEANHVAVKIVSKANPEINATINIRACAAPNNEEIECTCTVPEAERIYMFKEGLEDFNALASLGGAGAFNPVNQCLGGLMGAGGLANMYFTTQPFGGISVENGHLHFEYYISSLEKLNPDAGQVELSSSGADQQERNWPTTFLKDAKVGWNEVDLALSESGETSVSQGPFNPDAIKWFRLYIPTSAVHEEAIMVKNVFVYEAAPAVSAINVKLVPRKNLFIPVGKTADLKDFFDVEPAGASKDDVEYSYAEGAFTIDDKGIVTVTGNTVAVNEANHVAVTITSKGKPEVTATINIRACAAPNNEEIECTCTVPEADRIYMFKEGVEDFNALASLGGAGAFNPVNQCIGGLMGAGGNANIYFTTQPFGGISVEHGHLHFEYYVSSLEKLNIDAGQVELTSSGADQQERNWPTSFLKNAKVGWNEVDLALSESGETSVSQGPFNPDAIKWFRLYIPTSAVHEEAIMVKNVFVYEAAPAVSAINVKLVPRKNLFIPVGKTADLKDFFDVEPAGASKDDVEYSYAEGAFTIDDKGIVTVTGNTVAVNEANHVAVTITSKGKPEVTATINIRACAAPNNEEIECTCTVPEADRIYMFKEGVEDFNALASLGGAGAFNPVNQCIGGLMGAGGNANIYFTTQPFGGISVEHGHLHFEYYVSSLEKLNIDAGQVELTSSGADQQERNWPTSFLKNAKVGWNEVDLALSESGETSVSQGPFNPDAIKWFRFFVPTSAVNDEAIMVKNVFVYEEAAPVQITIDGNMDEWAGVKTGLTSAKETPVYMEFKVSNDDNNIYFYSKRDKNSAIWGGGAYIYYEIDADNNPATGVDKENEHGLETWLYFKPFGGSADSPAIATAWSGEASSSDIPTAFQFKGKISDGFVEVEASLPLNVAGVTKGSTIRVFSWSNKSGDDFRGKPSEGLLYNVK